MERPVRQNVEALQREGFVHRSFRCTCGASRAVWTEPGIEYEFRVVIGDHDEHIGHRLMPK